MNKLQREWFLYRLIPTERRLTFEILSQPDSVTYDGDDVEAADGDYYRFFATNGYEVISHSRMDIQAGRLWILGAKRNEETRSGTLVFSSNEKRDTAYLKFVQAINEWAQCSGIPVCQIYAPEYPDYPGESIRITR